MKEEISIWNQISEYLEGSLSPEERRDFEALLEHDNELASLLEAHILAKDVVIGYEALSLKEQMKKDLARPKSSVRNWFGLPVLAALVSGLIVYYTGFKEEVTSVASVQISESAAVKKENTKISDKTGPEDFLVSKKKFPKRTAAQINALNLLETKTDSVVPAAAENLAKPELTVINAAEKTIPVQLNKVDSCHGVKLLARFYISPSCKDEPTGELFVRLETIHDGQAPYTFSLNNYQHRTDPVKSLMAGTYSLQIKDANKCLSEARIITVPSITCYHDNEHTYNPAYDRSWIIPYDSAKKARYFKIIDKAGLQIFHTDVSDGNPAEWNGESNTGLSVGIGYHLFFIEYMDGTIDKGAITILR